MIPWKLLSHVNYLKRNIDPYLNDKGPFNIDDTFIYASATGAELYADILMLLMTAASHEWQLMHNDEKRKKLLLDNVTSWELWDKQQEEKIEELTTEIINLQRNIVKTIADYPDICKDSTVELMNVVAESTKTVPSNKLVSNVMQYAKLSDELTTTLDYLVKDDITRSDIFTSHYKVLTVDNTPIVVDRKTPEQRIQHVRGKPMSYDLLLNSQMFPISTSATEFIQNFPKEMIALDRQFKDAIFDIMANNNKTNALRYSRRVGLTFGNQMLCLYTHRLVDNLNPKIKDFHSFETRCAQIANICLMEQLNLPLLRQLRTQNEELDIICTEIEGFISGILNILIHAYAVGDQKSSANLRYIPPPPPLDEINVEHGMVSEYMRQLNNIMIYGPMLTSAKKLDRKHT